MAVKSEFGLDISNIIAKPKYKMAELSLNKGYSLFMQSIDCFYIENIDFSISANQRAHIIFPNELLPKLRREMTDFVFVCVSGTAGWPV